MANEFERAEELLTDTGAGAIPHPGGTLLAHLRRIRALLESWGAPEDVQLAGLCHATYGTDGFGTALLLLDERPRLVAAIGAEAEALVYLYGSCDRRATYPLLGEASVVFTDRFTGTTLTPAPALTSAFVEITAANELDVVRHNADIAAEHGPALRALFERARQHLSPAAIASWIDVTP
jgi:hypothetical protein